MTLYLDDFSTGQVFTSVGRTLTEADIMAFAGVSGDFNQLHINELWVTANTPFRGRIAHGLLVLAISSGLATPGMDDVEVIAYLEASRKFVGPTYPGDTIHAVTTVLDTRRSLLAAMPRWRRIRAQLSLRSLLPSTAKSIRPSTAGAS